MAEHNNPKVMTFLVERLGDRDYFGKPSCPLDRLVREVIDIRAHPGGSEDFEIADWLESEGLTPGTDTEPDYDFLAQIAQEIEFEISARAA